MGRHPLDLAVSLYHQGDNLDRGRLRDLTGQDPPPSTAGRPELHDWLLGWIDWAGDPSEQLDSLPGVLGHLGDAWSRRHEPNVVLVHYDDLSGDLDGQMRRLAARLGITVDEDRWPELVDAATFERIRDRADQLVPDPVGVLKEPARFFRQGTSGEGRGVLTATELAHYHRRAAAMAAGDLLTWLHHEPSPPLD